MQSPLIRHLSQSFTRVLVRGVAGVSLAALVLAQQACFQVAAVGAGIGGFAGAKLASDATLKANSSVEVRHHPAQTLTIAEHAGGADTTYTNVVAVFGRVRSMRGDTLWIIASEVRTPSTRARFSRSDSPVVVIVAGEGVRVRNLRNQGMSALVGAVVGAGVATAVVFLLFVAAMGNAST